MPVLKLTKAAVDNLPFTDIGQTLYCDTELSAFWLLVGKRSKTYLAKGRVGRKDIRCTIGKHGVFTTEEARRDARLMLADMARGIDPNAVKNEKARKRLTLEEALGKFFEIKQDLSPITVSDYKMSVERYLKDWRKKPLDEITKEMVVQRNAYIRQNHGGDVANKAMRVLSSVYNTATLFDDNLPENPVTRLSRGKLWYKSKSRDSYIKDHQMAAWYASVIQYPGTTIRDYLLLLLFTGLRKSEGLKLTWDGIDFEDETLTIKITKNKRKHVLPLCPFTKKLLLDRYQCRESEEFVFPGKGKCGHLTEPKKAIQKIIEQSGIEFMLHDLRRTFITTAESLDLSSYALKYMLNHLSGSDVTARYIIRGVERVRAPMNRTSEKLLKMIHAKSV
jgi:integrase